MGRQVNLKNALTYIKAVSNLYFGSRLVVLVIRLLLLLRKCMRGDEAAKRFCNVVRIVSKLRWGWRKGGRRSSCELWNYKLHILWASPQLSVDSSPCIFLPLACPPPCLRLWTSSPLPLSFPSLYFSSDFPLLTAT